jgi:hypothetical protein
MPDSTARDAFNSLNVALAEGDWQTVGLALDPKDVATFRDRELAVLVDRAAIVAQARRQGQEVTSWSSMAVLDPERLTEFGSEPQVPFPGAPTLAELASLEPMQFLLACAEAHAAGAERLSALAHARGLAKDEEQLHAQHCQVIGELPEGDELVHVLYRSTPLDQDHPTEVHIRTLRYVDGKWRVCLDHELYMHLSPMFAFHAFDEPLQPELGGES